MQQEHYSYNGKGVYTSPADGSASVVRCCEESRMLAISEYRREPAVHQLFVFIEGRAVYTGVAKPASEPAERPTVFQCCSTYNRAYRYALLGVGDLLEKTDETVLTDGTSVFRTGDGRIITEDGVGIAPSDWNSLAKKRITDTRQRWLFCNGEQIGSHKRYDGLFCCGDYALCVYVDDDYLSGWQDERYEALGGGNFRWSVDRKYTANPGWGDKQPPAAKDRATWDDYKSLYPGFKVDVFCEGKAVGTFDLSDANSPIYYDKLIGNEIWKLLAAFLHGIGYGIGDAPWTLEGPPRCAGKKLLIPYNGGLTTVVNAGGECFAERRVFP